MEKTMNGREIYFFISLSIFFAFLIGVAVYYWHRTRARKYPYGQWEQLMKRLVPVDRDGIAMVALDMVDQPDGSRHLGYDDLEPEQISSLVGGMKGLENLERNCEVLVDLAFYVQQWYPEALVVAEDLRLNAREIAWHVSRLKTAEQMGKLEPAFSEYAQQAIITYYLMTRRVLTLYDEFNIPGLTELRQAL
jgi:hypothetical protein